MERIGRVEWKEDLSEHWDLLDEMEWEEIGRENAPKKNAAASLSSEKETPRNLVEARRSSGFDKSEAEEIVGEKDSDESRRAEQKNTESQPQSDAMPRWRWAWAVLAAVAMNGCATQDRPGGWSPEPQNGSPAAYPRQKDDGPFGPDYCCVGSGQQPAAAQQGAQRQGLSPKDIPRPSEESHPEQPAS
jgi:hypothetical protein